MLLSFLSLTLPLSSSLSRTPYRRPPPSAPSKPPPPAGAVVVAGEHHRRGQPGAVHVGGHGVHPDERRGAPHLRAVHAQPDRGRRRRRQGERDQAGAQLPGRHQAGVERLRAFWPLA